MLVSGIVGLSRSGLQLFFSWMKIGNEKALIMRLHLLQAIVLFHQNRRSEAQNTLVLAESELLLLKISDASVTMLVDMGKCSRFP